MTSPLRSLTLEVVIPAYNAADFIHETLHHLALQTRPADVITVVNDRSTDATLDVVAAAARELAGRVQIRVLQNTGPQGPSAARNTAIRQSDADVIALMDADDIAEKRHHETLLSILTTCPHSMLAFGNSLVFSNIGIVTENMFQKSGVCDFVNKHMKQKFISLGEEMFCMLTRTGIFSTSACAFLRKEALDIGLFDEGMRYSEDTDFFLRLSLRGDFHLTTEIIARKRVHGNNMTKPQNKVLFCRGSSCSLARLRDRAAKGDISLTERQKAALSANLRSTLFGYLYEASLVGQGAYRDAVAMAWRAGFPQLALDPRHLARLCLRSVLSHGGR